MIEFSVFPHLYSTREQNENTRSINAFDGFDCHRVYFQNCKNFVLFKHYFLFVFYFIEKFISNIYYASYNVIVGRDGRDGRDTDSKSTF